MTDNEIVKALECCNQNDCKTCPYGKYNTAGWCCMPKLRKDTLDLINRQKAEIERLKKGWKADVILTANVKAEAYREFAERLKKALYSDSCRLVFDSDLDIFECAIDNLLKELVGEGGQLVASVPTSKKEDCK